MTIFKAALASLNLNNETAASLIISPAGTALKTETVEGFARGRDRVPEGVWQQLAALNEQVETAADQIIADQEAGEDDAFDGAIKVDPATIDLPHLRLAQAAVARAIFVLGADGADAADPYDPVAPTDLEMSALPIDRFMKIAEKVIAPIVVGHKGGINFLVISIEGMSRHPYLSPDWVAHNSMYAESCNTMLANGTNSEDLRTAVNRFVALAGLQVNSTFSGRG